MSEGVSRLPFCTAGGLRVRPRPPSSYIPTSNETRVRLEGFWKIIASVLPLKGWKGVRDWRRALSLSAWSRMIWSTTELGECEAVPPCKGITGPFVLLGCPQEPVLGDGCLGFFHAEDGIRDVGR